MSATKVAGVALIIGGTLGLVYGSFSYTKETHQTKLGPLEFAVEDRETIKIPGWASVGAIAAGAACCCWAARNARRFEDAKTPPCLRTAEAAFSQAGNHDPATAGFSFFARPDP